MKNDLRTRLKKNRPSERSVETKIADFFAEDENLKKYARPDAVESNKNQVAEKVSALVAAVRKWSPIAARTVWLYTQKMTRKAKFSILVHRRATVVTAGVIIAILGVRVFFGAVLNGSDPSDVQGATTESTLAPVEPDFSVVQSDSSLNPTEIAYDADRKVASYGVTLADGTDAIISQQEVSAADASRESFLLGVARSFDINKEVQTDKGPLFIGSNQKQRVMTAVFQEGVYLIFIRTNNLTDENEVIQLAEELQI